MYPAAVAVGLPYIGIMTSEAHTSSSVRSGGRRWPAIALILAALLLIVTACGGGPDPLEGLEFVFDDEETTEGVAGAAEAAPTVVSPYARLSADDWRHPRVAYVYDMQAMAMDMEHSLRSMVRMLENGREGDGSLDWVVQVHDLHRESEELRLRAYNFGLDEDLVEDYVEFHASFLEAVQIYALGADRMLEAAILLGPTGRTVGDLTASERAEFVSLLGEGVFYMQGAEVMVSRSRDDIKEIIKYLRVR